MKIEEQGQIDAEKYGNDNLISIEGIGEELLEKILDNIEKRYKSEDINFKNIYSLLGNNILIAINPYGDMNIIKNTFYTKEIKKIYEDYFNNMSNERNINPPKAHIYYLTEDAYRKMLATKKNQNFIITGDSGSGKTESTKLILEYLTNSNNDEISKNIMDSNPILEAFGNAKTIRNDNSSRFGKFIEINFSEQGKIIDAIISSYLLEKSRVVQFQDGEENFKIFYLFVLGKNEEEEKKYKIKSLDYYKYLKNEKNKNDKDYKKEFEKIKDCLKNFKFTDEDRDNIFKILSGILYLGNIEFISKKNKKQLDIVDNKKEDLINASEFLGLTIKKLTQILTQKYKPITDSTEYFDMEKAENTRDSIAKELYSELFKYILDKINIKIEKNKNNNNININDNKYEISILDIFGFENFVENSFEQLCINYANERLQQYFNKEIFKLELKLYQEEKINCDKIEYTDNTKVVEFIDRRKISSIFLFLKNVVNNFGIKNKDEHFINDINDEFFWKICKKNKNALKAVEITDVLEYHKNDKNSLYIRHYAGTVKYNIKDMVKKNVSKSNSDINEAFKKNSKNELIKFLYKDAKIEDIDKFTGKTLTENFRDELDILFKTFDDSNNRYIKCIKPNNEKKENNFVRKIVHDQMVYGGIEAAFQMIKKGYIHKNKEDFIKEYMLLFPDINKEDINKESFNGKIKDEIAIIGNNKFNDLYQIGLTKFFMKEELKKILDEKLLKIEKERKEREEKEK